VKPTSFVQAFTAPMAEAATESTVENFIVGLVVWETRGLMRDSGRDGGERIFKARILGH
jgi:hypothetical protein